MTAPCIKMFNSLLNLK